MKLIKFVYNVFGEKTDNFKGNLGANTIEQVSKKELYIILSNL